MRNNRRDLGTKIASDTSSGKRPRINLRTSATLTLVESQVFASRVDWLRKEDGNH